MARHGRPARVGGQPGEYDPGGLGGNDVEEDGQDFVEGSDSLTRAVNQAIAGVAQTSGATYVDAYTPLKGSGDRDPTGELLDDGDHPNQAGHQLLMQAVLSTLLREGAVDSWSR